MRRIIVHAGFHRTGTTSLQQTLRANRAALRPDIRLVLRPGMTALCESARGYSRSREDYDLGLVKYEAALLAESLQQEDASTIIISSEDLSGHMPGRHGLHGYGAAPDLMHALSVAFQSVLPEDKLEFYFTTRTPDAWLRSCYAQHLRASRMIWDEADYMKRLKSSADHKNIIDLITRELPDHQIRTAALEDHANRRLGIVEALLDYLALSDDRRLMLKGANAKNTAPNEAVKQQLLALNRSALAPDDLRAAKHALLSGGQDAA
ncbi:hypothetical protein OS189_10275 [Sulfitobacter sp. F26169L]|uniref:hypothetical protein n=1 Tax=Sulfitobacter sp. F26169L TaxID=2996015 RepID=UPI002260CB50|nr:hypothetical protein [Sulfitobacter sp. F26169L]MCX7566726.1 hypothetical protein [Sulfitobacter sp. F26169L]